MQVTLNQSGYRDTLDTSVRRVEEAVIRDKIERQYLGEIQRLQDGLHKVHEATSGMFFSYDADSELLDSLTREYVRESTYALLSGQPIRSLRAFLLDAGISLEQIPEPRKGRAA